MMCSTALANIAYVYREAGAYGKAEETLNRAYEMEKNASENESNVAFSEEFYSMLRAGLELEKGEPDKALEYLDSLDKLKEDPVDVPLLYASCYALKGMKEEAMAGTASIWKPVEDIRSLTSTASFLNVATAITVSGVISITSTIPTFAMLSVLPC